MLKIDKKDRASIMDIINSDWITNGGTEEINLQQIDYDDKSDNGNFGNFKRLITNAGKG